MLTRLMLNNCNNGGGGFPLRLTISAVSWNSNPRYTNYGYCNASVHSSGQVKGSCTPNSFKYKGAIIKISEIVFSTSNVYNVGGSVTTRESFNMEILSENEPSFSIIKIKHREKEYTFKKAPFDSLSGEYEFTSSEPLWKAEEGIFHIEILSIE